MHTRTRLACFVVVSTAVVAVAQAQDDSEAVRFRYQAPEPCPSIDAFETAVMHRTRRARAALPQESAREFEVALAQRNARWQGRLTIREQSGATSERTVEGDSCQEVMDAVALVTALAIDPRARTVPAPELVASASAAPPSPGSSATVPSTAPAPPQPHSYPAVVHGSAPHRLTPSWGAGFGVQVATTWGPAPAPIWTAPLFVQVSRSASAPGPSYLRLTASYRPSPRVSSQEGAGRFVWTTGRLDVCVVAWQPMLHGRLLPCAMLEAGALRGEGADVDHPQQHTRPWVSLGLGTRATATITGPMFLEIQGMLGFPLVRDRFYLEPDTTLHRTPAVSPSLAAGVGSHFD